jgi:PPK2 family polyphosphate:nucleotide phosphotransferase
MGMGAASERWRVEPGRRVDLSKATTSSTAGAPGGKRETKDAVTPLIAQIAELQQRLWGENRRALLVVFQAMDCGGKDGAIRRVFTGVNPQGFRIANFKEPSDEELDHDFLWRIHKVVPAKGQIGIFNRSHYEDVGVVRVLGLVPKKVWQARYGQINDFEAMLTETGTRIVKCFLHVSKEEQAQRLQARLDDPAKHWKFRRSDLDARKRWDDYMAAYSEAIRRTTTESAPWFIVPADRKWYRDWAVANIVLDALTAMDPRFPPPEEDLSGIVIE